MADEASNPGQTAHASDESTLTAGPGLAQPQLTARPGDRFGHYKILEEIGQGGCGVVFVAEQEQPVRRRVALKVIKLGMDTRQVIGRFEAERQALAMMDHPNIAKVLDAGTTDTGRPFFVMELVKGIKITDYCDRHNLSTADRLKLFIQVCQAVQHAHQKGIIHRDLKPSNILVTLHDGPAAAGVPKVIDFGIAKAIANQKLTDKTVYTALEQFMGTPAYMSPEQAEMTGLDIDTRSDIYSLGVLLYELLTGETPFNTEELLAQGLEAMRRTLREKDPARPSTRLSTMVVADLTVIALHRQSDAPRLVKLLRGDLDWMVMKCLEKDRGRRYDTANGLAMDIERHLKCEPVVARPPSRLYEFQKTVRRNKGAFAAVAGILAALVLGLGVSTWMFVRERLERRRAVAAETKAQSEANKSAQVADFLKEMLEGVGPSVAQGRDTKLLREILEKTVQRLDKDLTNQPEVEAKLLNTIGVVYIQLGDFERAAQLHRRALEVLRTKLGNLRSDVADSLDDLASALGNQGSNESEALEREALDLRRKLFRPDSSEVADSLRNLGWTLGRGSSFREADAVTRQALEIYRKLFGEEHVEVARCLNNLGVMLTAQGKHREAEPLQRQALAIRRKLLGADHPDLIPSLHNLASTLGRDQLQEAEALDREALALERKLYGNEHLNIARSLNNLGTVLAGEGKMAEAEAMLREGIALYRKLAEQDTNNLAITANIAEELQNLGTVLRRDEKLAQAEPVFEEALAIKRRLYDKDHRRLADAQEALAFLYWQQKKFAEAEPLLLEALAIRRKVFGNEHSLVAKSLEALASLYSQENKFAEAEPLARECLAIYQHLQPDDWLTFGVRCSLGGILLGQKEYQGAEPLLVSGFEGMLQRADKIPKSNKARLKTALTNLVEISEATGRPDQASQWRKKLDEVNSAQSGQRASGGQH